MKMTKAPCKIEGLQCTAIEVDLMGKKVLKAKAMLLRDPNKYDGLGSGQYNKDRDWSPRVVEKLDELINAMEEDLLLDVFAVPDNRLADLDIAPEEEKSEKVEKDPLVFPTLGGPSGTRQS